MSLPPAKDDYVGEPAYPSPWATRRPREGLRDADEARIVCLAPDVCKTPVGSSLVPIPYQVVDFCGHDANYTPSVRFTRLKAMVYRSNTTHVHGDKPGVAKGVKSGTVEDICEPIGHAAEVRAEGSHVIRHLDAFWMNARNTVGEAQFVKDTRSYEAPKDDDPVPGSLVAKSAASDEGRVMSDASPEPLIMGAQYAQAQPVRQVPQTRPATPQTRPAPRPLPPAANDNDFRVQRRGVYARPSTGAASRLLGLLGLAELGHAAGDMAGRWYVGPDGVVGRQIGEVVGTGQVNPFSPQGQVIGQHLGFPSFGPNAQIDYANGLLSLKAGYPVDFRQVPAEELEGLVRAPWPSAEQLRENSRKLKDGTARRPAALPQTDTVRISERDDDKDGCIVGTYDDVKNRCPGGQAHHIVPDFVLRYGNREDGERGINRIPNMPSFGNGAAICVMGDARVAGTEHNIAHSSDSTIFSLGAGRNPPHTAPIGEIIPLGIASAIRAKPRCAAKITAATALSFAGVSPSQLARTKQTRPLPSGATLDALRRGQRAGNFGRQ